jgi:hypothetical protein
VTDRISSYHTLPATTFYLESDPIQVDAANNRTLVRNRLRAMNGPGGSTGSVYGGSGVQIGYIAGPVMGWSEFGRHSGTPFLPSGYPNGATRWNDGPFDVWVGHDGNGNATVSLQMSLEYGNVRTYPQATYDLGRIARAPGAPGKPVVSNIGPVSVSLAWTNAPRGHADVRSYQWQMATDAGYAATVAAPEVGLVLSDNTANDVTLTPGTRYWVRVRAWSTDGWGAWSESATFETLSGGRAWDGTQWRNCRVRVWDGTQWRNCRVRVWDGTQWRNTR